MKINTDVKKNKLTHKGFSLIELSIILLVLGLLVAGIIGASTMSINATERHNTVQGLNSLHESITKLGMLGEGYGAKDFTNRLIKSKQVPGIFSVNEALGNEALGTIKHNLSDNGRIIIMGNQETFYMNVTGLKTADCIAIVIASNNLYADIFFDLLVAPSASRQGSKTPLTFTEITTMCATGNILHLVSK